MFKIVIPCWNSEKYITKCISSLLIQDYKNWKACIVLDPSTDNTLKKILNLIKKSNKISLIINDTKKGALENTLKGINYLEPLDEDIITIIDGDDWLLEKYSLSIVQQYYKKNPNLLVTHGSYINYPDSSENHNNYPYTKKDFKKIRKVPFRASHLRTFKYKLFKKIKDEDLKDKKGNYFTSACDVAIMFPLLEMAGYNRTQFIHQLIYVYNRENPYNNYKIKIKEQMKNTDYIASKKPYNLIKKWK
jgi:glycosyltransferase involved in cell wall biosynthesis